MRVLAFYGNRGEVTMSQEAAADQGYAAAREGAALLDVEDRGVLAVTGPLRQKFLHNLLSNDVAGRGAGQGCLAALMDVRGHVQSFLRVLVESDTIWLEAPVDRLGIVEQTLAHYRVAAPVRFQVMPTSVLALIGPSARAVLADAGAEVPDLAAQDHVAASVAGHAARVMAATDLPAPAFVLHLAPEAAGAVRSALRVHGAAPLSREAFDALRVEQGRPWYGVDVGPDNLLHETGLVREYHSPTKGCYVGQEVMARLDARGGNVNKLLRGLRLSTAVAPGTPIRADDREVGRVTTAAISPRLGPIAMGYVHRSRFEPGTRVDAGGTAATVDSLPLDRP
jgi:tRNA-modifying protein YgfZ